MIYEWKGLHSMSTTAWELKWPVAVAYVHGMLHHVAWYASPTPCPSTS